MEAAMTTIRALWFALALPAASALAAEPEPPTDATAPVADDAVAQDEGGDDLEDILGPSAPAPTTTTVGEERRAVEEEARQELGQTEVVVPDARRKVIKTITKKPFVKLHRLEAVPYVGMVTNDPFIRRILFGANLGYHLTDIFEIELQGSFAPNFGEGDYKPITRQITAEGANQVAPEISRMMWHMMAMFNYSPFFGKIATRRSTINFDIYASLGAGVVGTKDDLELIGNTDDPLALATEKQVHPGLTLGGGLRVAFNKTFALRFETRTISYIGVLESTKLELKNNLTLMLGASIFFGRRLE
jgi:outer membrane beta-barrel protein